MKYNVAQFIGLILMAICGHGVIRLMILHEKTGALTWTPAGFGTQLVVYLIVLTVGVALTSWARPKAKAFAQSKVTKLKQNTFSSNN